MPTRQAQRCHAQLGLTWRGWWQGCVELKRDVLELCTEAVVSYKVDFLSMPYIPPTVKNYLKDQRKLQPEKSRELNLRVKLFMLR